ncbi:MAG: hypothetical protein ACRCZ1_01030 [Cetobacterium sp.]
MKNIISDLREVAKKHKIDIIGEGFIYINGLQMEGEIVIIESEEVGNEEIDNDGVFDWELDNTEL